MSRADRCALGPEVLSARSGLPAGIGGGITDPFSRLAGDDRTITAPIVNGGCENTRFQTTRFQPHSELFADRLGLHEQLQIVASAGF